MPDHGSPQNHKRTVTIISHKKDKQISRNQKVRSTYSRDNKENYIYFTYSRDED